MSIKEHPSRPAAGVRISFMADRKTGESTYGSGYRSFCALLIRPSGVFGESGNLRIH